MPTELSVRGIGERGRPVEQRTLHFDLSHLDPPGEYSLHACLREHPLQPHTPETLAGARERVPLLRAIPDHRVTHFAELELPADAVALLSVTAQGEDGGSRLMSMAIHVPQDVYRREQERSSAEGRAGRPALHPKLRNVGVDAATLRAAVGDDDPAPYPRQIDDYKDAHDAAVAFLFHHREVMDLTTDEYGAAYVIHRYLEHSPTLPDVVTQIQNLGNDWMTQTPVLDEHGNQMHDDNGQPLWTQKVNPQVTRAASAPLASAIRQIKNDPNLEGVHWTVQQGVTATDYGATRSPVDHAESADVPAANRLSLVARAEADASGFNWTMQNLSPGSGFSVDNSSLSFTAPPTTAAWSGTGFWAASADAGGEAWPYAQQLLDGRVYLKITTAEHAQGLVTVPLVKGTPGDDTTTPFTVDLSAIGPSCTATLVLNAMQTSLAWTLSLQSEPLVETTVGASFCDADGNDFEEAPLTDTTAYGTLTFNVTNSWLRHLSAYVEFLDDSGNAITPDPWSEVLPSTLRSMFQPDDSKKYVGLISPVSTICGIPIPAEATELSIPVPPNAAKINVLCGGLGTGDYDSGVCGIGVTCTVVGELAMPVVILFVGASISDSSAVKALLADKELLFGVCAVVGFLIAGEVATETAVRHDALPALVRLADSLGPLLLKTGLKAFIAEMAAVGTAERAIPFVDIAFEVFNGAVTAAQLVQTTVEVLESPFVFTTQITRSIDVEVTLAPDPRYHEFPPESIGGHYTVLVVYDNNATYGRATNALPTIPSSDPITIKFIGCPAGGNLTVRAFFYAPNGWQAGQGHTGWLPALGTDGATLEIPKLEITTNEVPLSAASAYQHKDKIVYDTEHRWLAAAAPQATMTTPSPYLGEGKQLVDWTGITLAQGPGQVAYGYEATGLGDGTLYSLTNLSILGHPETEYAAPTAGFAEQVAAVYDPVSPDDGTGQNFWLDPSQGTFDPVKNRAGGTHLRRVTLGFELPPPEFAAANGASWGRFTISGDRYAFHPKGYVLGISYDSAKLQILRLPSQPSADEDAPVATLASGKGFREGLMNGPVALGVALDGRVLILEALNRRVQAFAIDGTPVPCFGDAKNPSSTMPLYQPDGAQYLDVSVEAKGYVYVLGYSGDAGLPTSWFVDIYEPNGDWLVRTTGVAAAKIVVDQMRSLYTLNYEIILGADGRPEPSISLWLPPPPPP